MLDKQRLENHIKDGYRVKQVSIYFSSDPDQDDNETMKQALQNRKFTMHTSTLQAYIILISDGLGLLIEHLLESRLYNTEIKSVKVTVVLEKETESGSNTRFDSIVLHTRSKFLEVSDQILHLPWESKE